MPVALAALSPAVLGILALVIALAAVILVEVLDNASQNEAVPGFIRWGLRQFVRAIHAAVNALIDWLASIATVGLSVLVAPARAMVTFGDAIDQAFFNLASVLKVVWRYSIPYVIGLVIDKAAQLYQELSGLAYALHTQALGAVASLGNWVLSSVASLDATLRGLIGATNAALTAALARSVSYLEGLVQAAYRGALAAVAASAADLVSRLLSLRTELLDLIGRTGQWAVATALGIAIPTAQRYADAIVGAYRGALDMVAGAGLARVWDGVLADVDSIAQAIPGSLADILSRIGAIPRVRLGDLAGVLSIVTAISAISLDWVARCGTSLCKNVLGFGDELAALEEEVIIAAILELAVTALRDPRDAANDIAAIATPDITAAAHGFTDILATV